MKVDLAALYVEPQGHYGHRAPKATWLYAVGCDLPELRWGPVATETVVQDMRAWERRATP